MNNLHDLVRMSKTNGRYTVAWYDSRAWHTTHGLTFAGAVVAFRQGWQNALAGPPGALMLARLNESSDTTPTFSLQLELPELPAPPTAPTRLSPSPYRSFNEFSGDLMPHHAV
jgi:hypothetical protein